MISWVWLIVEAVVLIGLGAGLRGRAYTVGAIDGLYHPERARAYLAKRFDLQKVMK